MSKSQALTTALISCLLLCGCRLDDAQDIAASAGSTATGSGDDTTTSATPPTATSISSAASGSATSTNEPASSGATTSSSTGTATAESSCRDVVVVMGYWPPSNEMLRPWSTDLQQNPSGWTGEDWRGLGYDVHAFFPEFPPDGNPSNDAVGDPGAVGSPESDLRVDYQDTSADFWRIIDEFEPTILVTTSRGNTLDWELEAIEGGHGVPEDDPSEDWSPDFHGSVTLPTQATIDPRSWNAISSYRAGQTLASGLPLADIAAATNALGIATVEIDETGTSGRFLSGFLGLHGLYYSSMHGDVIAGHIHVGTELAPEDARHLIETTLETILLANPPVRCR